MSAKISHAALLGMGMMEVTKLYLAMPTDANLLGLLGCNVNGFC